MTDLPSTAPDRSEPATASRARLVLAPLLLAIPLTAVLDASGAGATVTFVCAVLGIIPVAAFLGRATEEISLRSGPGLAALLNASFGNAIELLIAARLLLGTNPDAPKIVRASIVGSLVTNLLLLIGLSVFAGGLRYKEQRFNAVAAGSSASLLIIAFAGVALPTLHAQLVDPHRIQPLSRATSVVMAIVYVGGVIFTVVTHRHLFDTTDELKEAREPSWSIGRSVAVLVGSVAVVGWLSGVMERTVDAAGQGLGLSKTFVGVIVIGLVTNVAENLSAISYARKDQIDLSLQIGTSSANQIVLFVVPILVLVGAIAGRPFNLDFTPFELVCMLLPVLITNHLAADGQCNWLEGLQLIGLYALIGTAFYFVP